MKKILLFLLACMLISQLVIAQTNLVIGGGNLRINGSSFITLNNAQWVNNGQFVAGTGTVLIVGNAIDSLSAIGGDSTTTFYNLSLNKATNGSQLKQTIQVDNALTMTRGNLDLNTHNLDLGSANGRILSESDTSRILGPNGGFIVKTVTANAPSNLNPGNFGVQLTSAEDLGIVTVRRGHVVQNLDAPGNTSRSIDRYFEFEAANNVDLNVSGQIQYLDSEVNNFNAEAFLGFWRQDSSLWFNMVKTSANSTTNTITVDNINLLSRWTLGPENSKLSTKIFLEGPYSDSTGLMDDLLRVNNLIPLETPYTGPNYMTGASPGSERINTAILIDSSSNAIVDWVFIELRTNSNFTAYGRSALLQRDGDIVDLDGQSPVSFAGLTSAPAFFVVIRHRNHLGIRSLNGVIVSSDNVTNLDFTNSNSSVLGGANALKQLPDGKYALFSGDFEGDGQIQLSDFNNLVPFIGLSGYLPGDINLNGQVQLNESQIILLPNVGRGAQFTY
ncbi:MAG: hypothetical protein AAF598_11445 [Bacteroidota bacterium]